MEHCRFDELEEHPRTNAITAPPNPVHSHLPPEPYRWRDGFTPRRSRRLLVTSFPVVPCTAFAVSRWLKSTDSNQIQMSSP
jgi:hypothetical protein